MLKCTLLLVFLVSAVAARSPAQTIDSFDSGVAGWTAAPASGVALTLASDKGRSGNALKVSFDFQGRGGWAAFRKEIPLDLADNYEISFWLKGEAPSNTLEFKLIDRSGENVWWVNRREFQFAGPWRKVTFRKRHVTFAWGPVGGGEIRRVGAVEFAITAGEGGKGTLWIDDLVVTPREPVRPYDATPVITSARDSRTIDFTRNREYGGVIIDWRTAGQDRAYDVQTSNDGKTWQTVREVRSGLRARDYLQLPESESRYLRIALESNAQLEDLADVRIMPLEWGESRNKLFESIATDAPAGAYPKYFRGTMSYWTVIGENGGPSEAMINEEGAVEVDKRSFSLEPFVYADGKLITWNDVERTQSLYEGWLPIPSVTWRAPNFTLETTSWMDSTTVWIRYRVGHAAGIKSPTLFVAVRPFQVNPSSQFLNTPGGATTIRTIELKGDAVIIDGERRVVPHTKAGAFGAAAFDQGDVVDFIRRGTVPGTRSVNDPMGAASAVLAYPLNPTSTRFQNIYVAITRGARPAADPVESLGATLEQWRNDLSGFTLTLPDQRLQSSIRSNLGYILINRDRAAIQPGSRSYERSWIRDGSLTSAALLRLGHAREVREFVEWYAPYQYADGKVPCCVDQHGAGPVPENDSHGQLIYVIAEYFRFTRDTAFVRRLYLHVERAVSYMDSLRNSRRTAEYRGTAFFGLMPQSISHEGYSAKPMHSYWDDFFALKGFKDAVWLARALGDSARAARWVRSRDEFQQDVIQSLRVALKQHKIDYLPGAAELGDFDATSTTVGISPASAQRHLPAAALKRTFEKYWENFVARRDKNDWDAYTPYEWRVVGTYVRLGERRRAHSLLNWFMKHQRPPGWHHWAEVVHRDEAALRFIGDMPHTWVGSDFIRSVLDMFAYEDDDVLVIAAGILPEWVRSQIGASVSGLHTPYGEIAYNVTARGKQATIRFAKRPDAPPNGFIIRSPLEAPIRSARADGTRVRVNRNEVKLAALPRVLTLTY